MWCVRACAYTVHNIIKYYWTHATRTQKLECVEIPTCERPTHAVDIIYITKCNIHSIYTGCFDSLVFVIIRMYTAIGRGSSIITSYEYHTFVQSSIVIPYITPVSPQPIRFSTCSTIWLRLNGNKYESSFNRLT